MALVEAHGVATMNRSPHAFHRKSSAKKPLGPRPLPDWRKNEPVYQRRQTRSLLRALGLLSVGGLTASVAIMLVSSQAETVPLAIAGSAVGFFFCLGLGALGTALYLLETGS